MAVHRRWRRRAGRIGRRRVFAARFDPRAARQRSLLNITTVERTAATGNYYKKTYLNGLLCSIDDAPAIESRVSLTKRGATEPTILTRRVWCAGGTRHRENDLPAFEMRADGRLTRQEFWTHGVLKAYAEHYTHGSHYVPVDSTGAVHGVVRMVLNDTTATQNYVHGRRVAESSTEIDNGSLYAIGTKLLKHIPNTADLSTAHDATEDHFLLLPSGEELGVFVYRKPVYAAEAAAAAGAAEMAPSRRRPAAVDGAVGGRTRARQRTTALGATPY